MDDEAKGPQAPEGKKREKGLKWWGWLLIVLSLVVVGVLIWALATQTQNVYGCLPGEGCVEGQGSLSYSKCMSTCADAGASVYRCNEVGACVPLRSGTGPTLSECERNCFPTYGLLAPTDGDPPYVPLFLGSCDQDPGERLALFRPLTDAHPEQVEARLRLAAASQSGFDPNSSFSYPLTTPLEILAPDDPNLSSSPLYMQVVPPVYTEEELRKEHPLRDLLKTTERIDEAIALGMSVGAVARSGTQGRSWTIKYEQGRGRVAFGVSEGGLTYYLYAMRPTPGCPADALMGVALPLDPLVLIRSDDLVERALGDYGLFLLEAP